MVLCASQGQAHVVSLGLLSLRLVSLDMSTVGDGSLVAPHVVLILQPLVVVADTTSLCPRQHLFYSFCVLDTRQRGTVGIQHG